MSWLEDCVIQFFETYLRLDLQILGRDPTSGEFFLEEPTFVASYQRPLRSSYQLRRWGWHYGVFQTGDSQGVKIRTLFELFVKVGSKAFYI